MIKIIFLFFCTLLFSTSLSANEKGDVQNDEILKQVNAQIKLMQDNSHVLAQYLDNRREHIIGVEYVLASSLSDSIVSRFGHALLRFIDDDPIYGNDVVISFEAVVRDANINFKEGLLGGYELYPHLDILENFWSRYVRTENRPLNRYIIPSTNALRNNLIDNLIAFVKNPKILGNYSFLNKNCAGVLADLIINSGFPYTMKLLKGRNPDKFDDWLEKSFLNLHAPLIARSPLTVINRAKAILKLNETTSFNEYEKWPSNATELLMKNLEGIDLLFLYHETWDLPEELSNEILKRHNYRNGEHTFSEVVGFVTLPFKMYQTCATLECAKDLINQEVQIWGEKKHEEMAQRRFDRFVSAYYLIQTNAEDNTTYDKFSLGKKRTKSPEILSHFHNMIEADGKCTYDDLFFHIEKCSEEYE